MRVSEKILMNKQGLMENGPITIVAFGDSVTHGAVGHDEIDYENVYWHRLAKRLNEYRNYVPVNVINAGIGGTTAIAAVDRMEAHVFSHNPDLVIVCFGLNDVNRELKDFLAALGKIFDACNERNIETVFMTPNMLNTYVRDDVHEIYKEYALKTAEMQNSGRMDLYMSSACELAREKGITVCDCYSEWKKLSETTDTTALLANGINHPKSEMHALFADMLYDCVMGSGHSDSGDKESTMYNK